MRNPKRTLDEWMNLITECRRSGLSDAAWCQQNGISTSCFYNAVSRLRKKACELPAPNRKTETFDLTSVKQDVVEIAVTPELIQPETVSSVELSSMYLDNSHTIEISVNGMLIKLNNSVNPVLLERILHSLRSPLC